MIHAAALMFLASCATLPIWQVWMPTVAACEALQQTLRAHAEDDEMPGYDTRCVVRGEVIQMEKPTWCDYGMGQ